ncbi:hypothetical protein Tco_0493875 [Tanacetum coccineum]
MDGGAVMVTMVEGCNDDDDGLWYAVRGTGSSRVGEGKLVRVREQIDGRESDTSGGGVLFLGVCRKTSAEEVLQAVVGVRG